MCKWFTPLNKDEQSTLSSYMIVWSVFFWLFFSCGTSRAVVAPLYSIEWHIQYSNFKCVGFFRIYFLYFFKYSYPFLQHHNIVLPSIFDTVFFLTEWERQKSSNKFYMKNVDIESYFIMLCCTAIRIFFRSPRHS